MGRPAFLAAVGLGTALALVVAGCSAGGPATPVASTGAARAASSAAARAASSAAAAPASAASGTTGMPGSPGMLAPAGRAPGGATGDGEGTGHGQASDLAQAIGCEDVEDQQHLPSVNEQLTCRRGTERVYILTFTTVAQRDTYLDQALQIAHGGWGVLGPTWMIHVEDAATAEELGRQLQGTVRQDA